MEKRSELDAYDIYSDHAFTRHTVDDVNLGKNWIYPVYPVCFRDTSRWDNSWIRHVNYDLCACELVLDGAIEYSENGVKRIAEAGELFLIMPHSNVKIVNAKKGQLRRKLELLLHGNAFGLVVQSLGFSQDTLLKLPEPDVVEAEMRHIGRLMKERAPGFELSLATYKFMLMLADIHRGIRDVELPDDLQKVKAFIHENLTFDISVLDIAAAAGISASTLRRRFARYFSVSPLEYLIRIRLEQAAVMLKNSDLPVKEIGFSCGFNSALYFAESFRKAFGVSPSVYRRQK